MSELAHITTTEGEMVVEFWPDVAPKTVENFKTLAQKGFYDGTCFHRIIKGFMIQGGDPLTKDASKESHWGTGGPGHTIKAEFNDRSHQRGVISMARSSNPDSAGSQFFICDGDASFLDRQYTAFGKLIKGDDVLAKIADTPVGSGRFGRAKQAAEARRRPQHQNRPGRRGEIICWSSAFRLSARRKHAKAWTPTAQAWKAWKSPNWPKFWWRSAVRRTNPPKWPRSWTNAPASLPNKKAAPTRKRCNIC